MKRLFQIIDKIRNGIAYFTLSILITGSAYALWDFYLTAPRFMLGVEEQLASNAKFSNIIGDKSGNHFTYGNEALSDGDTASFSVTVTGRCDSSYVKVLGYYYKRDNKIFNIITDTIIKSKCNN
ncbi:hypothetical protein [Hymenobacter sp. BT491]|uniref:hypothetical protein n=1 Tax=Hymenobacter sp. BT491 TaxID=2766779 RepID=UPI0016537AFD|nr:hypothetical protein [Hymenobacter sp. BT491]MBC6989433.1 hypothetical protein [Hymenobacter sp. BT491]